MRDLTIKKLFEVDKRNSGSSESVGYRVAYWKILSVAPNSQSTDAQVYNPRSTPTLEVGLIPANAEVKAINCPSEEHLFELPEGLVIIHLCPGDLWPNMTVVLRPAAGACFDGNEVIEY